MHERNTRRHDVRDTRFASRQPEFTSTSITSAPTSQISTLPCQFRRGVEVGARAGILRSSPGQMYSVSRISRPWDVPYIIQRGRTNYKLRLLSLLERDPIKCSQEPPTSLLDALNRLRRPSLLRHPSPPTHSNRAAAQADG